MNLSDLRQELKDKSKTPFGERYYPITSEWIPIADALALVDRFEKDMIALREKVISEKKLDATSVKELTKFIDAMIGPK